MADYGSPGGRGSVPWPGQGRDAHYPPPPDESWRDGQDHPSLAAPTRRRGRGPLVAVLVTLLVLLVGTGGLGYLGYHLYGRDEAQLSASPSGAGLTAGPVGSADPTPSRPVPESSTDPRFVRVGQCVTNEGSVDGKPKLMVTECTAGTYQVLRRFDEATSGERDAEAKCGKVDGYTNWYFFNSPLDTLDFVLCLRLR